MTSEFLDIIIRAKMAVTFQVSSSFNQAKHYIIIRICNQQTSCRNPQWNLRGLKEYKIEGIIFLASILLWVARDSKLLAPWTPQYRIFLCWNMLAWISVDDRIPFSFTNFITTPEFKLSCFLYTSPDSYHT